MATAQATQASSAKTTRRPAAKSAARAKTTRRATASRSTASNASATTKRSAQAVKTGTVSSYAERAVLIPVGAALIAREQVVARVNDTIGTFGTPAKASAQLRKFERRGNTARNRLEREVRKTRVRVEREVRQTRTRVEREARRRRRDGEELASRVQERILNLV
ncbi:MAG TPA: hypothetical protein VK672_04575 [Solirubrobacteraceae bacterium]|jgi:hypothetical protein|nr:hypothetical protein [Solirubrobacteraceae bacterium]